MEGPPTDLAVKVAQRIRTGKPGYGLDGSALLAWLHQAPGDEKVEPLLGRSVVSAANLSETLLKGLPRGTSR